MYRLIAIHHGIMPTHMKQQRYMELGNSAVDAISSCSVLPALKIRRPGNSLAGRVPIWPSMLFETLSTVARQLHAESW